MEWIRVMSKISYFFPPPSPGFGEARPPSPTVAVKEGELFFQPRILPLGLPLEARAKWGARGMG